MEWPMRAYAIVCAAILFTGAAHAQNKDPETQPITSCAEIVGHRHNPYDVQIDLEFTHGCNYTISVRGKTVSGVAVLERGTLSFRHRDEDSGMTFIFTLRRSGENLSGRVIIWPTSFPIQFFPVKK
ncbi:MAG: hypothetical protein K2U26_17995 [Cyclobacteriaceae bacterium]|nr:hypothetical protein [Cyclobacteriaceae bacterium]